MDTGTRSSKLIRSRLGSIPPVLEEDLDSGMVVRHRNEILGYLDDGRLISRQIRAGALVRVARGFYAEAAVWKKLWPKQRHVALAKAVARNRTGVQFSHATAALLHEFPWIGRVPTQLQCVVGSRADRSTPLLRPRRFPRDESPLQIEDVLVTSPVRTVVDVTCDSGFFVGLPCADNALARNLFTQADLRRLVAENQTRKGIRKLRLVAELADGRVESAGESLCRGLIHRLGFVPPVLQYEFWDGGQLVGRGDFYWPDERILLEFDGKQKCEEESMRGGRSSSDVTMAEKVRENRIRRLGVTLIRLTWHELRSPGKVEQLLLRTGVPKRRARY